MGCDYPPSYFVAISFLHSNDTGSIWGNIAYTQTENLPLLQLASVTGMWGIQFVMLWLAPVVNLVIDGNGKARERRAGGISAAYALVMAAIFVVGGARLTFFSPADESLRASMVLPRQWIDPYSTEGAAFLETFQRHFSRQAVSAEELAELRGGLDALQDPLFSDIRDQARAGAELVVVSEASLVSFSDLQDQEIIDRARRVASEENIYLGLALAKVPVDLTAKNENRLLLIDPSGELVETYWKHETVPVVEAPFAAPGSPEVMAYESSASVIGGVICYDLDTPQYMQSAGRQKVDVLIAPTGDWPVIEDIHARMASMRAVEQGFSLVRPANYGRSLAVDYQGRTLSRMDYGSTTRHQLTSVVPTQGVTTLYTRLGDAFAWLCVVFSGGALALLIQAKLRQRSVTG